MVAIYGDLSVPNRSHQSSSSSARMTASVRPDGYLLTVSIIDLCRRSFGDLRETDNRQHDCWNWQFDCLRNGFKIVSNMPVPGLAFCSNVLTFYLHSGTVNTSSAHGHMRDGGSTWCSPAYPRPRHLETAALLFLRSSNGTSSSGSPIYIPRAIDDGLQL